MSRLFRMGCSAYHRVWSKSLAFRLSPNVMTLAGRRYQVTDSLTWQRGRHRFRTGFEWGTFARHEYCTGCRQAQLTVWSPQSVRKRIKHQAANEFRCRHRLRPSTMCCNCRCATSELMVGPGAALERDFRPHRVLDLYRLCFCRHVASHFVVHRERRTRVVVQAQCPQSRPGEAGARGSSPWRTWIERSYRQRGEFLARAWLRMGAKREHRSARWRRLASIRQPARIR